MSKTLVTELVKKPKTVRGDRMICFVCTGNTCRSPMAAAVFNDISIAPEVCSACDIEKLMSAKNIRATSAGLSAFYEPISENAVKALRDAGVPVTSKNNYEAHISENIELERVREAELVVGITSSHAMRLMSLFPQYASKITCMPKDIPDPFGGSLEEYKECLAAISEGVKEIYEKL